MVKNLLFFVMLLCALISAVTLYSCKESKLSKGTNTENITDETERINYADEPFIDEKEEIKHEDQE